MRRTELTDGLGDRGIGVQAAGFAIVGCVCLLVLQLWSASDHFLYPWFETTVTKLYWAFVVPLAATFDWGRKMFERGKAIREAKKAEILAKVAAEARQKALQGERKRIKAEMERMGIAVTPEMETILSSDAVSDS